MHNTLVKSVMTCSPAVISPDATLKEAARMMAEIECGILPVGTATEAEGVITDRDIVIRAVAKGKDITSEKVRDYMTRAVFTCTEDTTLEQAAAEMYRRQVKRLVVKDASGKMTGILTFGCVLRKDDDLKEMLNVVQVATGRKAA